MADFAVDISAWVNRVRTEQIPTVIKQVVQDLGEAIVARNPVGDPTTWKNPGMAPPGYVGGRSRGSWMYGFNEPKPSPERIDPSGQATIDGIRTGVQGAPHIGNHYITSNVPYIERLEDGYSQQAPTGMVKVTIQEFQAFVAQSAREVAR